MKVVLEKVLRRVKEDRGSIDLLARDLDVSRGTVDAILERLAREGYVEKMSITSSCSECPLSGKCEGGSLGCDGVEMYVLTPKGREYVEQ